MNPPPYLWRDWDRDERHARWFTFVVSAGVLVGLTFYVFVLVVTL